MKRKVLACLLVCVIAFTLALPAFAAEPIQPRAALCANCGQLNLFRTPVGEPYPDTHTGECVHGVAGASDRFLLSMQRVQYRCGSCGFNYMTTESTIVEIRHLG